MARLPLLPPGQARDERPERPFTGYKLAHAVLSADGSQTGFVGLTMGGSRVYSVIAEASCVWNRRHVPPRRWCGCGFYCLHALADARSLACATENRAALLLEVTASGRYIRYERGLRYSRQRVRAIRESKCGCGNPGIALADAGTGLVGWRHLAPACARCSVGRQVLTLAEFAALLDGPVVCSPPLAESPDSAHASAAGLLAVGSPGGLAGVGQPRPDSQAALPGTPVDSGESPFAVLAAEIALLHARLDDLQSRLDR